MTIHDLVERVRTYNPGAALDTLEQAYEFSATVHRGQRRRSGEPYLTHPLAVAGIIAEMRLDVPSVATGLLHDTVEDTLTTIEEIQSRFGPEIAELVDGVTKIGRIDFRSREEKQAENFRKMLLAMARDIRVILIKLADRTHNMRTLGHLDPVRQQAIAQETLDIYAPIAHRLGIYWIKSELEDNALRYLHPEVYYQLKRSVAKKREERERYTKEVVSLLARKVKEAGIEAEVHGRPKHFYSIYQKMQQQNLLYEQVHDLIAFRIIVDSIGECYEALGVVHANWKPVPGRFKDYIALPKANGYQSLHTAVIGPRGQRMEVQIRTRDMHRVAEYGVAAHWRYKKLEGGVEDERDVEERFAWLRQMLEWQQHLTDPDEFLRSVKEDLFSKEVFVFTPKGDLLNFPTGSTVIDFAYRIHSEVGRHCTGARVNGRIVPLRYQLRSGDSVEIITTPTQTPSKDWLKFVKTSRAKERIRSYLKTQQRGRSVAMGRSILERDLARHHLDLATLRKHGTLANVAAALGVGDEERLLADIGYGKLATHQVLAQLLPKDQLERKRERGEGAFQRLLRLVSRQTKSGVRVSGIDDMLVRFGQCCQPLPGERILGFITRGRGVTIHTYDCPKVLETDPQRRVEVEWENAETVPRAVKLEVTCVDRPGLLAAMSQAISSAGINISRAEVNAVGDHKAQNRFEVMVKSLDDLNSVMRNLGRVRGVMKVTRVRT
ncbi:MAG TPA: bifunctional (p)ppGpp synthetase/guanosine-3',5'-bis(diphosphate) 3'-pyrophosphohydrolase [Candidatus Limnocylindria bacterium]|nr:bifunctional (p)ppGpp synthetase/guanosine-3',5'-bis(diphosphate) 3'-pyrophosphohydrolase [Candidatus Limnocylindria bacterium]